MGDSDKILYGSENNCVDDRIDISSTCTMQDSLRRKILLENNCPYYLCTCSDSNTLNKINILPVSSDTNKNK